MTQIFLVSSESVEGDDAERITLNGKPIGPEVHSSEVQSIVDWFTGYLTEQVQAQMQRMGFPVDAVEQTSQRIPVGPCPSCGKGPGGALADVVEDPCPVCRR